MWLEVILICVEIMCQRYNTKTIKSSKGKEFEVDSCIADLVLLLNNNGFKTVASCCGHGIRPGNIALEDGREFFIIPNYKTGREVDKFFPSL